MFQDNKRWSIQSRISSCILHEQGLNSIWYTVYHIRLILHTHDLKIQVISWPWFVTHMVVCGPYHSRHRLFGSRIKPIKDAYCIYFVLFYCSFHDMSTSSSRKTNSAVGRSLGTILWISIYPRRYLKRHSSSREKDSMSGQTLGTIELLNWANWESIEKVYGNRLTLNQGGIIRNSKMTEDGWMVKLGISISYNQNVIKLSIYTSYVILLL